MASLEKIGELFFGAIFFLVGLWGIFYLRSFSTYKFPGLICFLLLGMYFIRLFLKEKDFKLNTVHALLSGIFIIISFTLSYISFRSFILDSNIGGLVLGILGLLLFIYGLDLFIEFFRKVGINTFLTRTTKLIRNEWEKLLKVYLVLTGVLGLALFGYIVSGDGPVIGGSIIILMEILIVSWVFFSVLYEDLLD